MLWWLFFIGPIVLAIIFKCMTMTFNIGTSISKRRAKKDAEAVERQVEIAARQQMAQFAAENNSPQSILNHKNTLLSSFFIYQT